jgi:HEAT repeat protein
MSERFEIDPSSPSESAEAEDRFGGRELPPVQPPTAGFIIQLFVVPAVIVGMLIGGWLLIRRMVSSEQDWQTLVVELRSSNKYRRDRGAAGLAQLLRADTNLGDQGQQLSRNLQIAGELAGLLGEQLDSASSTPEEVQQRAFLARTLGLLDVPDTVLPVLQEAMQPSHDREVRKNAVAAVALIAGRSVEAGQPLTTLELVDDVVTFSADEDPFLRQLGAYTLGLFPTDETRHRLIVLLSDADGKTRVNAAVGLARQNSTAGFDVFKQVLTDAAQPIGPENDDAEKSPEEQRRERQAQEFEQIIAVKNVVKAVGELSDRFDAEQRTELSKLLGPVAENIRDPKLRIDAEQAQQKLDAR